MQEVIYYPVAGDKRGGTGYRCLGGFGYGAAFGDAVTLKPDRPTDLFAPSLTTQVEEKAAASDDDHWLYNTPPGQSLNPAHAARVRPSWTQPATNALTAVKDVAEETYQTGKLDLKKVPVWVWGLGALWFLSRR